MDEEKVRAISTRVVEQILPEQLRGNQNVVGWVEMIRQAVRLTLEQQEEQQMLDEREQAYDRGYTDAMNDMEAFVSDLRAERGGESDG